MTHLAMIIPTIDCIGGAERQTMLLAKTLAARGWRVSLIALSGSGSESSAKLEDDGIKYLSLGMRKAWIDPRGWLRYLSWHRRNQPEIVHAHLPHATWFARVVRLLAPVRVSLDTIHTSKIGSRGYRSAYRTSEWLTNQVTCVSKAVAQAALLAGMVQARKLSVIPNGVEVPPSVVRQGASQKFAWVAVGRLAQVKDYPTLLQAFASLSGQPELTIVGTGPDELTLRRLANQLQIKSRVVFAGFQSDVPSLLRQADALVLSSLWEGLPMSVLEAQAAGLPVVATDGAGTREAILDGVTGVVVPVGDAVELAIAMSELMAMKSIDRQKIGEQGRQFVEQQFAVEVVIERWEFLYRDLLERHRKPSRFG